MSAISAVHAQAAMTQLNMALSMVKKQNEAQQGMIEMIAASVDAYRGQNLNISA